MGDNSWWQLSGLGLGWPDRLCPLSPYLSPVAMSPQRTVRASCTPAQGQRSQML